MRAHASLEPLKRWPQLRCDRPQAATIYRAFCALLGLACIRRATATGIVLMQVDHQQIQMGVSQLQRVLSVLNFKALTSFLDPIGARKWTT